MEQACYVYILRCRDGTLYTGWTNRLPERVAAHNQGKGAKYTKARRPVTLVYWEQVPDKAAALRREWAVKKLSRAEKLGLIAGSKKRRKPSERNRVQTAFLRRGPRVLPAPVFFLALLGAQGKPAFLFLQSTFPPQSLP